MSLRTIIFCLAAWLGGLQPSAAQTKLSKVLVNPQMIDSFSFATKWDYSWEVFKDDHTGKFTRNDDQPVMPADTVHLFFTANCTTNVQGGYGIRYCFAEKRKDDLLLSFSDGLPAYASVFYSYVKGDSFYFRPGTVYPVFIRGQQMTYVITKQVLTLNKAHYELGDDMMGYVDVEFVETVSVPNKEPQHHTFYLRGYFRTKLKPEEVNDR